MSIKIANVLLLSVLLSACTGDDDPVVEPPFVVTDLDGDYALSAPSTTEFDTNGGACGDGSGSLNIDNGTITGTATTDAGLSFDVSGTVDGMGQVNGGFALSTRIVVTFDGAFEGTRGSGNWVDEFECRGTLTATKNP